jgi:hypothetical protein
LFRLLRVSVQYSTHAGAFDITYASVGYLSTSRRVYTRPEAIDAALPESTGGT